ncbi:MAG: CaiB/BaiF CoA-transferase family protein [Pseudomonadota bacterium]
MGPLDGIRIIELQGIGPGPFCGMMLADMGADVIRVDRTGAAGGVPRAPKFDLLARGRRSIRVDLKSTAGRDVFLKLVEGADGVVEGFRPGVIERLGIGPDVLLETNPRVVIGRMTGWGQEGPIASVAGHDINYIALAGALFNIGTRGGPPSPPLNLVGDFGGGGMLLAFGMVSAMLSARATGRGQVVDAAMVDGTAILCASMFGRLAEGTFVEGRGASQSNGATHFYDVYECADGEYISIASLEPQFYAELCERLALDPEQFGVQMDPEKWPEQKVALQSVFKTKTRDQWCDVLQQSDICFAPVLRFAEAPDHPHNAHRETFVSVDGIVQPAPAPRFSETPGAIRSSPAERGEHTDAILSELGLSAADVQALHAEGAIKGLE